MSWQLTLDHDTYESAREEFAWDVPEGYNIARDVLRKHDDSGAVALYQAYPDGRRETYTFAELDALSNQFAHGLADLGVERGDRVAVVVPQKPANPITHLACWKLGAVSLPLSPLFGESALRYRFSDSGVRVVVVDAARREAVDAVRGDCPDLEHLVEVDGDADAAGDVRAFDDVVAGHSREFDIVETDADTPALVIYTSGSTGPPKGALHGHGVWLGHCPAFYMYFERDLTDAVCWTPADWAWIGALGDLVFPAWHYGASVLGYPMRGFDPATAYELLAEFDVTHAFLPPTAVRMMMDVDPTGYDLDLRAVCSGGEPLTPEILDWADEALDGVAVNELYGQTEANLLVTNCRGWFPAKPGSMGKPVPGHDVAVIDPETGDPVETGAVGELAVRRGDDPVVFTEYWNQPEKTAAARVGDWHRTGDLAARDEDGYLWFKSRTDDIITTSGYRVGPAEVERAVLEHPSVAQVGVVGVPDATRGEIIKAFVQPVAGATGDDDLREAIQQLVRDQLAKYEYPREIEFVDELPQTTTGKIQRTALRERESEST